MKICKNHNIFIIVYILEYVITINIYLPWFGQYLFNALI